MTVKRVAVIDDDRDVREGLQNWLSSAYLVSTYESAEHFLAGIDALNLSAGVPTCLLLDFQMPGMNGVELQDTLKAASFLWPIIFMSGNAHHADIIAAWRGGATDFILKPFSAAEISHALRQAFANLPGHAPLPITRREAQVLQLLGQGMQQQQVAEELALSLRTVKMYRAFLKHKLDLNSLMELARFYDQHRHAIAKIAGSDA